MINALDMTRAQYVMMFGRSEITHAMAEGWAYDNAESMVTLCGRKGGSVSHFDSGSLQEVTCTRCIPVMTKLAAQANTDEMIAQSEARVSAVTVQGESDIPVLTSADGPIVDDGTDAGFVETMVTQEYRLSVTVDGAQIDLGWHEFTVNAAQANDSDVIAALYGERHGSGKPRHGWGSIISVTDVMGD